MRLKLEKAMVVIVVLRFVSGHVVQLLLISHGEAGQGTSAFAALMSADRRFARGFGVRAVSC